MVNGMTGPKAKDKVECRLEGSGWAARRRPLTHSVWLLPVVTAMVTTCALLTLGLLAALVDWGGGGGGGEG